MSVVLRKTANPYEIDEVASHYASLGYEGTYLLAARDIPAIIGAYGVTGSCLDFACGSGRSSRFLKSLGLSVTGVDISKPMLQAALATDPDGTYLQIKDGDLTVLAGKTYDLIYAAFPFEYISSLNWLIHNFIQLGNHLKDDAILIVIASTPELYKHEWVSFTSAGFERNLDAGAGDPVTIIFRTAPDRPVIETLWTDASYREVFGSARLSLLETRRPLGYQGDGENWISEASIAPFVIYVLAPRR